jgi:hypothetical protein
MLWVIEPEDDAKSIIVIRLRFECESIIVPGMISGDEECAVPATQKVAAGSSTTVQFANRLSRNRSSRGMLLHDEFNKHSINTAAYFLIARYDCEKSIRRQDQLLIGERCTYWVS